MRTFVKELTNPGVTLTAYLPAASDEMPNYKTRPAILVIPGGAYMMCSDREAEPIALSFLAKGYAAFVLRYSVGKGAAKFPRPLNDAEEAMELIIANAEEWGVEPEHIAAIGFSAGGHLAASAATMLPEEVRPAFAVLIYPVITAEPGKCHKGSFDRLLGTDRTTGDEAQWSQQNRVTASTPPTLLLLADDDRTVPPVNSTLFYEALKRNGVKGCSLRIYPSSGHGGGFNPDRIYRTAWRADVLDWLGTLPNSASH